MSGCVFVRVRVCARVCARVCVCVCVCVRVCGVLCVVRECELLSALCATNAGVSVRVSQRLDRASLCLGQSICSRESERRMLPRLAAGSRGLR
jgi:hypothetical protein